MLIDYQNVNICQDGYCVLKKVNLQVEEGDFIYLIGKVGSGKSSLLKTFYCELDVEEGDKIEVMGRNLKTIKRKDIPSLRKEMGVIFQDFQLLADRSVYENLQFVLKSTGWRDKERREARIDEVLKAVGMADHKYKMPHELSGGEQQHIAIARAILNLPDIIIADEPTGNLDPETACGIVELLKEIGKEGRAVIMSTHNISLLEKFPGRVFSCDDGTFKEVTTQYCK